MSVLAEFKEYQKKSFEAKSGSKEWEEARERMDVLWIQLSMDEMVEVQQYERQLWIESGKAND